MANEKTKGKGAVNESASAAEKNFVNEISLSEIDKAKQLAVSADEDKNEIPETTPQGNDVITGEKTPIQSTKESDAQAQNGTATESSSTKEKQEEQEKIKDKRGRKPLSDEEKARRAAETKEQTAERLKKEKSTQTNNNAESALNDDLNKYKSVPVPNGTTVNTSTAAAPKASNPEHIDLSKYISGALFLIAIDIIMPSIALKIASFVDKKYIGVDKSLLKLDSSEKKELEPLADAVVKILFGFVHPAIAFAVVMGIMYLGKFMLLTDDDFEDAADKQRKKAADKAKARGGRK